MKEKKPAFTKIAVKPEVKREIDIIAASEQRYTYEVVEDMLELYKAQAKTVPQPPKPNTKKNSAAAPITSAQVVAA